MLAGFGFAGISVSDLWWLDLHRVGFSSGVQGSLIRAWNGGNERFVSPGGKFFDRRSFFFIVVSCDTGRSTPGFSAQRRRVGNDGSQRKRVLCMSCFKTQGLGVGLTLSACVAVGEPLPETSLLGRYGMTPEQLPAATQVQTSDETPPSLFQLKPETPVVDFRFGERTAPEEVGNITIDNMARRDYERCLRLHAELLAREAGQLAVQSVPANVRCE